MNIAIVPYSMEVLKEPNSWLFYRRLKECYKGTDISWNIISEYDSWDEVDYFVFYNFYYSWGIKILKKINKMHMRDRIVFCMMEPAAVHFYHTKKYLPFIKKFTDCIVTWNKDMVDNKTVFFSLFHSWQNRENKILEDSSIEFENKKLLCNISGNKHSSFPTELYSERRKVIEYFEDHHSEDFDLYGTGWDTCNYKNYRGRCATKGEVYRNYKFALSLENEKDVRGYITEKIMDCIYYGIVPIYEGADDILEYIPQECFIPYSRFDTIEDLYQYIKSIDERQYRSYMEARDRFIAQRRYEGFTAQAWGKNVLRAIEIYKGNGPSRTAALWFFILDITNFFRRVVSRIERTIGKN